MTAETRAPVIDAKSTTFSDLFFTGHFEVPWHQRLYDWQPEHVLELLQDLDHATQTGSRCYFLGTVILIQVADGVWLINDGQQRMVTISLICACLSRHFSDQHDSLRSRMARRMLFAVDSKTTDDRASNGTRPRLSPPREDRVRYNALLRGRSVGTNGRLTEAWREIERFASTMSQNHAEKFFDFLFQRVEVACLYIPNSVDPNSVYETINCRGKRLSDLDLIRNYVYSFFSASEAQVGQGSRCDKVHDSLESIRTHLRGDSKFAEYARCYFQSRYGFLPKKTFYRNTRLNIQDRAGRANGNRPAEYVYDLVLDWSLDTKVELFRTIAAPSARHPFTDGFDLRSGHRNSSRNLAVFLRELYTYKVTQPLVFALLYQYVQESRPGAQKALAEWIHARIRNLTAFVMRTSFVTPKFEPSQFESEFSQLAMRVTSASSVFDIDVDNRLKHCDIVGVVDDVKFERLLATAEVRDVKKVKRLLFGINCHIQSDGGMMNENRCTVDHILPRAEAHWQRWERFVDLRAEEYVDRLGNLTLLDRRDSRLGNMEGRSFAEKKSSYAQSFVRVTRDIARYSSWSPAAVARRQKRLASLATQVWSFDWSVA